jgi:hypothetical protein
VICATALAGCHTGSRAGRARRPPARTTSTAPTATRAVTPTHNCSTGEVKFEPGGQPATAMSTVAVAARSVGDAVCRLDVPVTLTVTERSGALVPAEGNPARGRLVGEVRPGDGLGITFVWSGCVPGDKFQDRHEVTIRADVPGFGTFDGTGPTPRCDAPGSGSVIAPLDTQAR